ncbi:MAG: GNAT family N-acetyltransferase [Caulobacterales bacterium]|nr:GNAT family N-acetyltransferase [Caulobacterales bacterium]
MDLDRERLRRDAETPQLAGGADLPGVVADFAAAFAADPVFDWFLREGDGRPQALRRFFALILKVTANPARRIERPAGGGAAALWIPSEHMTKPTLANELEALGVLLAGCGLARFPRVAAMRGAMDRHHPHDRAHDYLYFLGVRPEAQGLGVGSRLLKAHLAGLDAAGRPAFLETGAPRTLSLYQGHGFAVIGEYKARPDAPTMWALWREPQAL